MTKYAVSILWMLAVLFGGVVHAAREGVRVDMEGTAIIGDNELPKVLYVVPWKDRKASDVTGPLVSLPPDAAIAPVLPEEFRRRLRFRNEVPAADR
jgi:hypothetical protein